MYPLTTTTARIDACNPCEERRDRAAQLLGITEPSDEPISYEQLLDTLGFDDALWCCQAEPHLASIWRRYAVWCARQVQHLMTDQRSLDALDVAERHANGQASDDELNAAGAAASEAASEAARAAGAAARDAWAAAWPASEAASEAAWAAAWAAWAAGAAARDAWAAAWPASEAASEAAGAAARDAVRPAASEAALAARADARIAAEAAAQAARADARIAARRQQVDAFRQLVTTGTLP